MAQPATSTGFSSYVPNVVPRTSSDIVKNELFIGLGIVALSGAVGLAYGFSKSRKDGSPTKAVGTQVTSTIQGVIIGIIIAIVVIIAYRGFFHGRAIYNQGRAAQDDALASVQQQRLARASDASTGSGPTNGAVSNPRDGVALQS
jgi:hypothetical protein